MLLVIALTGLLSPVSQPAGAMASATTFRLPMSSWRSTGFTFGEVWLNSCGGKKKRHNGVDISADAGDTVRAAANGKVIGVSYESPWGYTMLVEHSVPDEGTVISRYAHVRPRSGYHTGRVVEKGERIATVYNLGANTHFAFGIFTGAYDRWAWRGALPQTRCGGDPAFPHRFVDPTRYVVVHSDVKPPRTKASAAASVAGTAGWTRGRWTARFRCRDDASGCRKTQYRLDGGAVTSAPSRLRLEGEGRHVLRYRSIDVRGNVESWGRVVLGVDKTGPAVSIEEPHPGVFVHDEDVRLVAQASDAIVGSPPGTSGLRGVRFYFCPIHEEDGACIIASGVREAGRWAGSPSTPLERGAYRGWAQATDRAGNVTASGFVPFLAASVE